MTRNTDKTERVEKDIKQKTDTDDSDTTIIYDANKWTSSDVEPLSSLQSTSSQPTKTES